MAEDKFDIVNLYKYYSKSILNEKRNLNEKEIIKKFGPGEFKKFKAILYYENDPNMLPVSFQIDYIYQIQFLLDIIREDFSEKRVDFSKDINIDDDEIDKIVMKKLKGSKEKQVTKEIINLENFYYDFFKKNLPSFVITGKLNDLIRAGVVPIESWKIYAVTYSTQVDDKLLFRKIEEGIKKNKSVVFADYGYQIAFESANKQQRYDALQIVEFAKEFSKSLETSLFKDTRYYKIVKK